MRVESWKVCRLGDCVKFISGGTPSKQKPEYWDGSIPWVSCKDMKTTYLYDSQDRITEAGAANGTRIVDPETILIVVRGMILAQHFPVAMTKRRVAFNQDLKALQCSSAVNTTFLFYWLQANSYEILGLADEAAHGTKRLQSDRLQIFQLNLPPLATQYKIATIFSNYDRLIENNTRRIKILEEMARSLYDEWFVKFRFPGYEKTKMVDSESGLIPEDWQVKTLGNVCNIVMGQSPKSEFYNEIGEGLPFHQGVTNFGDRFPTDKTYCSVLNRIAEAGDILFSVRAPVGRINIATKKIIIGRGLCAIRSQLGNQAFLFQQLKERFQEEDSIGGGTIFKSVTREDMYGIKIIVPPSLLIDKFEEIIQPVFRSIEVFTTKNTNLRQTRDVLLPKLISGEIDVEKLDIETGIMNESEEVSSSSQEAIAQ